MYDQTRTSRRDELKEVYASLYRALVQSTRNHVFDRKVAFQSVASENRLKSNADLTVKKIIHFSVSDDKIS